MKDALSLDENSLVVHRSLALLYLATRRAAEAEPHFRAVAAKDASARLSLADYLAATGRRDEARTLLHEIERGKDKQDARAARLRRASLEYAAGRKAEAHAILDALVAEKPRNVEIRVAKARALLMDGGRAAQAVEHAREAVKADSGSPEAQYVLGQATLAAGAIEDAEAAFNRCSQSTRGPLPRASSSRVCSSPRVNRRGRSRRRKRQRVSARTTRRLRY